MACSWANFTFNVPPHINTVDLWANMKYVHNFDVDFLK